MAAPANPVFSFALFFALFLSVSIEAREMSSFAKFSPTFNTNSENENHETDSYDPSKQEEDNTPWYQRNTKSHQPEEERHPDTYTPWNQGRRHENSDPFHYSRDSGRFYNPSNTRKDFYNSNPFGEEDSNVKGSRTPNRYSQDNGDVSEAQGMSDVRSMANGKFRYDVNDESKHGSFYKSNTVKNSNVNRDEGYGQQYDMYNSKREASLDDPERLSAYDP